LQFSSRWQEKFCLVVDCETLNGYRTGLKEKRDNKTWSSAPDAYRCGSLYPAVEIDLLVTNYYYDDDDE